MSAYDSQEQAIARLRGRAEAAEEELEERHRLEAELAEEREAVKATERERNKMTDERNEAWDTLAAVREKAKAEIEERCAAAEAATDPETREYHYGWVEAFEEVFALLDGEEEVDAKRNIAQDAIETVTGNDDVYGDAVSNTHAFAVIASELTGLDIEVEHFPLIMEAVKLVRLSHGYHRDSWVDIVGYGLIAEMIEESQQ